MTRLLAAMLLLALAGCGGGARAPSPAASVDLEQAAKARGLVHDPADSAIAGVFARDTDRACLVPAAQGHRIGIAIDYGEGIACSATGTATRAGEALHIRLGTGEGCGFDARYDGEHIAFPGALPAGCARFCSGRASLTGVQLVRLGDSVAEARAMRDARGRRLCGD